MGALILFLTLYATQYSGNTLVGFAGRAYREGYQSLVLVTMLSGAVAAFVLYAPKLYQLSRTHNFITPTDYLKHRFKNTHLTLFAASLFLMALANYILTNLKAIGFIVVAVTGGAIPFAYGVIALSLIMVIYETMGGMRSVAWTDAIQGTILMIGVITIFITINIEYGGLEFIYNGIKSNSPEKIFPPTTHQKLGWFSTVCLGFFIISTCNTKNIFSKKHDHFKKIYAGDGLHASCYHPFHGCCGLNSSCSFSRPKQVRK